MRRTGDGLEKAVVARCCGSRKREWTGPCQDATRHAAQREGMAHSEMFDNSARKPSSLGLIRPNEYEALTRVASLSVHFYLTRTLMAYIYERSDGRIGQTRCALIGAAHGDRCSQRRVCRIPPVEARSAHSALAAGSRRVSPADPGGFHRLRTTLPSGTTPCGDASPACQVRTWYSSIPASPLPLLKLASMHGPALMGYVRDTCKK